MKTQKWVPCTEELALNPERVKEWRFSNNEFKFYEFYNGEIYGRLGNNVVTESIIYFACLIEVEIKERFFTVIINGFDNIILGGHLGFGSLEIAKSEKRDGCTHIIKLAYEGDELKTEVVWSFSQP